MMNIQLRKAKQPYVVYLNKTKLIWAGESLKNLVSVEFAKDVLVDLEFLNIRNLDNQVLTMVEKNNLRPFEVIIILSSEVYFSQQFASQAGEEMKAYLSVIPFDDVISQRFQNATGQQLVAVSQDLINPLVEVFKHHGFEIIAILPDFALSGLKTEEQFLPELANSTIHSLITLLPFSFYLPPKAPENMTSIRDSEGKIFSPRLILMIVFFVVLIGILVGVLFTNGYLGQKKAQVIIPVNPTETEQIIPTKPIDEIINATSSTQESTDSANINISEVQSTIVIEILNGSGTSGQAEDIQLALSNKGFKNLKTGSSTVVSQRTIILYNKTVSQSSLQVIVDSLEVLGIQSSAQESPELSGVDVRIMISR